MKRTGDIILGVIGVILNPLLLVGGTVAILLADREKAQEAIHRATSNNTSINSVDANNIMDGVVNSGVALTVASILGLVLGLIALLRLIKKNKPKTAGFLFISAALATVIISYGSAFLPAIFYLIAGLMSLLRKGKQDTAM